MKACKGVEVNINYVTVQCGWSGEEIDPEASTGNGIPVVRQVVKSCSSRHQIACFKAMEGLHPLYRAAPSQQCSVASFATLRFLSCLHSPGLRCSCCNVVRFCCDLESGNLVTATIHVYQQCYVQICKSVGPTNTVLIQHAPLQSLVGYYLVI
jgi:hypothetical protein